MGHIKARPLCHRDEAVSVCAPWADADLVYHNAGPSWPAVSLSSLLCGRHMVRRCTDPAMKAAAASNRLGPSRSWARSKGAVPHIPSSAPLLSAKGAVWYASIAGLVSMKNISISCCLCCLSKVRAQCHLWSLFHKQMSSCRGRGWVGTWLLVSGASWPLHTCPDASCRVGVSSGLQLRQGCL